ncbi:MAG: 3-hydroxyacyl-CoA dehydrogenase [Sphingomonadales bacterium]|nr:3-hydroxyacyl-CoA dehydrogenase [Sphingomonadales bacterium]
MKPEDAVRYEVRDRVAVLTIDFPPVNALGEPMRRGLMARFDQAQADPAADAMVIVGANDKFIAGADIREFGLPKSGPMQSEIQAKMEKADKPVVVAIDGYALGGGFEVALAAHYRVAASRAKVGLPEVNLGLLPGAGGTQRATRLAGPAVALAMILGGNQIPAAKALQLGLVDAVAEGDVTEAAIAFARQKVAEGGPWPVVIERTDKVTGIDPQFFADMRAKNAAKWKGMVAPFKIVDCVEAATRLEAREGLVFEKEAFKACNDAPSRAAQVHLFFAERAAAKVEGVSPEIKPKKIRSVGVIGAGTMGGGITMCLANAGLVVKLLDSSQAAIDAGLARVKDNYQTSVARGSTSQDKVDAALGRIETVLDYAGFADVDMIIEAVFENMDVKHEVFRKIDAVAKPGAVRASNTSALDIDQVARATKRPQDVIGMHFFSPANVMKLVEVVRGDLASPETIVTAMAFGKQIGKVPVLAGNCPGFIGNRILARYGAEGDVLMLEGSTPWQVDDALKEFGFPMGIYLMRDMAGLDVSLGVRRNAIETGAVDPDAPDFVPLLERICEAGRLGQKTGAGFYKYDGRKASPDPEVAEMLTRISAEKGVTRREIADEEIVWRVLLAMVNEGAKIVEEGIAQRASDIDVTYTFGYGFPKYRGGPMFWAEQQGLDKVLAKVREYEARYGARWAPAKLLVERGEAGTGWKG